MYILYELLGLIIIILSPLIIFFRIIKGKEDPKRFLEKFCIYSDKFKKEKTVWMHGSSVGEILSIIPLINELEKNKKVKRILITSSTTSSSLIFANYKFKKTIHRYFPIDNHLFSKNFINYWNPQVAIFVESEIWPNMIKNLYSKKIPIILLNARITKKSFDKWKILPRFAKSVFKKISLAMPQNVETFKYLKLLGVNKIKISGNLKYFGHKKDNKINKKLKNKFLGKEVWCAASTHSDEEIFIGKIHKKIKILKKNLITIIIPRHINRSETIINDLKTLGLRIIKHSGSEKIKKDTDIYLVDTYGEASKFYKLSKVTFLGGSLNSSIHHGGQNPLEPARLGNYILHGPQINNFKEVYLMLKKNKNSCKINKISDMEKKLIEKIKYKQPKNINKGLLSIGKKILAKNLAEINNYI